MREKRKVAQKRKDDSKLAVPIAKALKKSGADIMLAHFWFIANEDIKKKR